MFKVRAYEGYQKVKSNVQRGFNTHKEESKVLLP